MPTCIRCGEWSPPSRRQSACPICRGELVSGERGADRLRKRALEDDRFRELSWRRAALTPQEQSEYEDLLDQRAALRSLAAEARMSEAASRATAPAGPGAADAAARVRAARRRFLPYVVAGGAFVGMIPNMPWASAEVAWQELLERVLGVGFAAGIGVGMALGWPLLGWYERRAGRSGIRGGRLNLAIALLTVPAYVAAVWGTTLVCWIAVKVLAQPVPDSGPPNAWPVLIVAAAVLYPINYAFARRDTGRPDDFVGAVTSMTKESNDWPKSFGVVAEFLVGLAWFTGTLFALFNVLWAINLVGSLAAVQLARGTLFALFAVLVAINVVFASQLDGLAAGTVWTVRRMDRRRARRQLDLGLGLRRDRWRS
jgi:hypothetical protein